MLHIVLPAYPYSWGTECGYTGPFHLDTRSILVRRPHWSLPEGCLSRLGINPHKFVCQIKNNRYWSLPSLTVWSKLAPNVNPSFDQTVNGNRSQFRLHLLVNLSSFSINLFKTKSSVGFVTWTIGNKVRYYVIFIQ